MPGTRSRSMRSNSALSKMRTPSPPPKHNSPTYAPSSPTYTPSSPTYTPASPTYTPSSPTHKPSSPTYKPSSPTYKPSSPTYKPSSPTYKPSSPSYKPSSPSYTPYNDTHSVPKDIPYSAPNDYPQSISQDYPPSTHQDYPPSTHQDYTRHATNTFAPRHTSVPEEQAHKRKRSPHQQGRSNRRKYQTIVNLFMDLISLLPAEAIDSIPDDVWKRRGWMPPYRSERGEQHGGNYGYSRDGGSQYARSHHFQAGTSIMGGAPPPPPSHQSTYDDHRSRNYYGAH